MATGGDYTVENNFAKYVDGLFLGNHMYSQTKTWDPEGVVSTLPAVANTLFGIFCGECCERSSQPNRNQAGCF